MTINGLDCKLIEKRGKKAEIEIEGQRILVPTDYLPLSVSVGENLQLCFLSEKDAKIKEKELAKAILEEILNSK